LCSSFVVRGWGLRRRNLDSRYRGVAPPHYRIKIARMSGGGGRSPGRPAGERCVHAARRNVAGEVHIQRPLVEKPDAGKHGVELEGVRPAERSTPGRRGHPTERLWIKTDQGPRARCVAAVTDKQRIWSIKATPLGQFPFSGNRLPHRMSRQTLAPTWMASCESRKAPGKQVALVDDVDLPPAGMVCHQTKAAAIPRSM